FVYGSLRRGFKNSMADLLAEGADYVDLARYQGKLYDLGNFPGVIASMNPEDQVVGDVYHLKGQSELLRELDKYEGYIPGQPEKSYYLREIVPVTLQTTATPLDVWIYLFNYPVDQLTRVVSGDYFNR
ncbi:MAG: gamma-glutamylcyclotransferase family protein, partial [Chloroflexota bacterium]